MKLQKITICRQNHGHIATGDHDITFDNKLCKIFYNGPIFRESKWTDLKKAKTGIVEDIVDCINTW